MTLKKHTRAGFLLLLLGIIAVQTTQARENPFRLGASPTGKMHPVAAPQRAFKPVQSGSPQTGKDKVPSSMDLFVDRCKDAGGGLICVDGHYDCVRPSGESIPNW